MDTYTLYYISQDMDPDEMGPDDSWSVYSEQYVSIRSPQPIEGSSVLVATWPTEAEADADARRRQRQSHATPKTGAR